MTGHRTSHILFTSNGKLLVMENIVRWFVLLGKNRCYEVSIEDLTCQRVNAHNLHTPVPLLLILNAPLTLKNIPEFEALSVFFL